MDQRTVSSVIAGCPVADAPGGRIRSTNPARLDEVVADVALGDAALLVTAARAARDAQRAWADVPAPVRGRAIAHIGRLVEDNKQALAALVTREIGKPYPEALGEVQEIIDTCDFFLGEGRRMYGQTVPSEMPDKQLFTFRNPVGAVAVITAGNFPVAVPSWYIVPALLCGNTVVWKPAEYSAATAEAFHELFCRGGGLPPGVFNVVYADGPTTFAGLEQALDAGLIDKVGFTGSSEVGARIGELAGRHLQSACLELGGKNPMVVTANADIDLAVEGALFGGFGRFRGPAMRMPFAGDGGNYGQSDPRSRYGGGLAYCVRSCDGRYFPITGNDNQSRAENCKNLCPASETKVVYGSTIDNATKHVGATNQTISGVTVTNVAYTWDSATDDTSDVNFHTAEVLGSNDTMTVSLNNAPAESAKLAQIDSNVCTVTWEV